MLKIIFKKLIFIPIASFIVSSLAFLVVNVTPGDPVEVIAGGIASEETKNEIRAELGLDKNLSGKVIAVLGLTFKAETDDMRDAPSLTILPSLIKNGAKIKAHDPEGIEQAQKLLPDVIDYFSDIYEAVDDSDAVSLITGWK